MTDVLIFSALGAAGSRSLAMLEQAKGDLSGTVFGKPIIAGQSFNGAEQRIFAMPSDTFFRVGARSRVGEIAPGLYLAIKPAGMEGVSFSGDGAAKVADMGMTQAIPQLPNAWAEALHPSAPDLATFVPPDVVAAAPGKPSARSTARAPTPASSAHRFADLQSALIRAGLPVNFGREDLEAASTMGIDAAVAGIRARLGR